MTRKRWFLILAVAGAAGAGLFLAWHGSGTGAPPHQDRSGYIDPATCNGCHQGIAKSYRLTGMGRSFYRPKPDNTVEDFTNHHSYFNRTSDRYYSMLSRDGKFYQRRYQIGFDGKETNIVEKQIDYVIGSGNHARSYLYRTGQGTLVELPVSWYSENGGYWAMSPGYDRPHQPDFLRTVSIDCMFCHNGYPDRSQSPSTAGSEPIFGERISEGIDCQRCHGPGGAHVEAAGSGRATPDSIRKTIVNPARLTRDRQLEVCMQCHLETTSRQLPGAISHYDRSAFSYRPGEPLGDYFTYFDRAPGAGRDDNFEIAHAAYRLRKSECFRQSEMTCTTCHNPHQVPRGQEAVKQYVAVCKSCHSSTHASEMPARGNCIECHMPKRRAEDAVHTVLTDHYIQRRGPAGDLLAPLREVDFQKYDAYRGEVVPYYPLRPASKSDSELYTDVAQVRDGANLHAGIPKLRQDIEKYQPRSPEFYFELAEAYSKTGDPSEAVHWYEESIRQRADFRPAIKGLAIVLISTERLSEAAAMLEKAVAAPPFDPAMLTQLGVVYLKQGSLERAEQMLRHALNVNPDEPESDNLLGLVLLQKGDLGDAETYFRAAIAIQPELAEPHYNVANLLARAGNYPESAYHFEKALASQPDYVEAHHNYGNLLMLMRSYDKARAELEETVRLAPQLAQAHSDLADALTLVGRMDRGIEEYRRAIQLNPDFYEAHLALAAILARGGNMAEGRTHFSKAAESPDPDIRQAALKALR